MYRELAKGALKRTVDDLRVRAAELAEQKKRDRESGASRADNPAVDAERQRDAQLRELADQAHGVNLDLGSDLLMSLSAVDPLDMNVARFFVPCGCPHSGFGRLRDYPEAGAGRSCEVQ